MVLHGNDRGPGNNSPAASVDTLDAACARHDACTPDPGPSTRACNMRLHVEAERVADTPRQSGDLRMMARPVVSGASMVPSATASHKGFAQARVGINTRHPVLAAAIIDRE